MLKPADIGAVILTAERVPLAQVSLLSLRLVLRLFVSFWKQTCAKAPGRPESRQIIILVVLDMEMLRGFNEYQPHVFVTTATDQRTWRQEKQHKRKFPSAGAVLYKHVSGCFRTKTRLRVHTGRQWQLNFLKHCRREFSASLLQA